MRTPFFMRTRPFLSRASEPARDLPGPEKDEGDPRRGPEPPREPGPEPTRLAGEEDQRGVAADEEQVEAGEEQGRARGRGAPSLREDRAADEAPEDPGVRV